MGFGGPQAGMGRAEASRWLALPSPLAQSLPHAGGLSRAPGQAHAQDQPEVRVHLFCLPHAGSGAAAFFRWRRLLPPAIAVCPVLLPGRETRLAEPPETRWRTVVDRLVAAQVALGLADGLPFALFGHSMGSLLAYEWTRALEAAGLPSPRCLLVSGREAPSRVPARTDLHRLGDVEFVATLRARYGGVPAGLLEDAELRAIFLPLLRADLALVEQYRPVARRPLRLPVHAFAGEADRTVTDDGFAAWSGHTTGPSSATRLPGNHFYHLGASQTELLEQLSQHLLG